MRILTAIAIALMLASAVSTQAQRAAVARLIIWQQARNDPPSLWSTDEQGGDRVEVPLALFGAPRPEGPVPWAVFSNLGDRAARLVPGEGVRIWTLGSQLSELRRDRNASGVEWTPDGKGLVVNRREMGSATLETGTERYTIPELRGCSTVIPGHDGRYVLCATDAGVKRLSLQGALEETYHDISVPGSGPLTGYCRVSPDGSKLLVGAWWIDRFVWGGRHFANVALVYDVHSRMTTRVTPTNLGLGVARWLSDGHSFVFTAFAKTAQNKRLLERGDRFPMNLYRSDDDGKHVKVIARNVTGFQVLQVTNPDSPLLRRVPAKGYAARKPASSRAARR